MARNKVSFYIVQIGEHRVSIGGRLKSAHDVDLESPVQAGPEEQMVMVGLEGQKACAGASFIAPILNLP